LNVNINQIGDEGAKALAQNHILTALDISTNQIGYEVAKTLVQNQTLTTLDISANQIGYEGAWALARKSTLMTPSIGGNQIGHAGVKAFAQNQTLISLNINSNQISAEDKKTLQKMCEDRNKIEEQLKNILLCTTLDTTKIDTDGNVVTADSKSPVLFVQNDLNNLVIDYCKPSKLNLVL
jgi:hypothetical protein